MEPSTSRTEAAADEIARLAPLLADWSRRRPVAVSRFIEEARHAS
jgi:hypothetical protein